MEPKPGCGAFIESRALEAIEPLLRSRRGGRRDEQLFRFDPRQFIKAADRRLLAKELFRKKGTGGDVDERKTDDAGFTSIAG